MKILQEQFGAFIKFLHEPSQKEIQRATSVILNLINSDLQMTQGATGLIEEFCVIYRTPEDLIAFKKDPLEKVIDNQNGFWTFGIKAWCTFITTDNLGQNALKHCTLRLREGISIDPIETIK